MKVLTEFLCKPLAAPVVDHARDRATCPLVTSYCDDVPGSWLGRNVRNGDLTETRGTGQPVNHAAARVLT